MEAQRVSLPRGLSVTGKLTAAANTTYTIDLYSGAGTTYLGTMQVKTNGSGVATFTFDGLPSGASDFVTTATGPTGNTSQFSAPKSL